MRHPFLATALIALALPLGAGAAAAGPIESACMRSDRPQATRSMCGCIQKVANQTLRGGDQRRAAKFFRNPEEAHEVWMSKRDNDDRFWDRYKAFGAQAEATCAG